MKIPIERARLLFSLLLVASVACAALLLCPTDAKERPPMQARMTSQASSVTAVITPLPDEVSNGTWSTLDASLSNDTAGIIIEFKWDITYKGTTNTTFFKKQDFKFRDLGLYKIMLTVKDDRGNSSQAFTAVYSILDSNGNSLPDWWEMKYFNNLNQTATGDYDHDGHNNLQEYAAGTDPTNPHDNPGLVQELAANWMYLVAIAAAVVVALMILLPRLKKKQKAEVKKKIEAALEIERALESDK